MTLVLQASEVAARHMTTTVLIGSPLTSLHYSAVCVSASLFPGPRPA